MRNLANSINMLGFILQLGYFKANGKFFSPHEFRVKDIEHVSQALIFMVTPFLMKTLKYIILIQKLFY